MKVLELINIFENQANLRLQEDWDNCGLQVGNINNEVKGVLLCLDIVPEVIDEAIENNLNVVISHHPLIFNGIKKITDETAIEKCLIKAITNDISILSFHTNFDTILDGVSGRLAAKIGLKNPKILVPKSNFLKKLVVFVPLSHAEIVRNAIFEAGAGVIGNYDCCSFNVQGLGSFRAGENTNPFIGNHGELHFENEIRIETIFPEYLQSKIISAIISSHPYEEVAYDVYSLDNKWETTGFGIIGELEKSISELEFLQHLKHNLNLKFLRHSPFTGKKITRIAVCGGSGASFINNVIQSKADVYITGDIKYHDYFTIENKILLIDIGHYESEIFILEKFYDIILKKNPNFAIQFSKINTNPINTF